MLGFLFVCVSIAFLNNRDCAHDFAVKALEYRNSFDTVGYGKVCSCAPASTFFICCQTLTQQNAEVQKTAKFVVSAARVRQNKPIEMKFDS